MLETSTLIVTFPKSPCRRTETIVDNSRTNIAMQMSYFEERRRSTCDKPRRNSGSAGSSGIKFKHGNLTLGRIGKVSAVRMQLSGLDFSAELKA